MLSRSTALIAAREKVGNLHESYSAARQEVAKIVAT